MLNFTVGPVQMSEETRKIGSQELPYFRTPEFSRLMKENEKLLLRFVKAPEGAKSIFLSGSGTAAMEASVMNCFDNEDKVLIVNGGSFGQRFVDICRFHGVPYSEITLNYGEILTKRHLEDYESKGYTGLLINMHETSTGVLYDMDMIGEFCKRNHVFLVVDCVSSFLADPIDMGKWGANVAFTGSQKALALPPGIAVVVLDKTAIDRISRHKSKSMYLDFVLHLKNMERGQTPFTPAVGVLIQMNARLKEIDLIGIDQETSRVAALAKDFREKIKCLNFDFLAKNMSNAATAIVTPDGVSAYHAFEMLKDEYGIFVCPNGGMLSESVFRVGHIGNLTVRDNDILVNALKDMREKKLV